MLGDSFANSILMDAKMFQFSSRVSIVFLFLLVLVAISPAQSPDVKETSDAMHRAVDFFRSQAGHRGAYVFRVSSDLKLREGEGKANRGTGWLEPPGTPSIGMAYLEAYQLTGENYLLEAAKETAEALLNGQLESGGWTESIEWLPEEAKKYAYRNTRGSKKRRDVTTLDDNKTQSALQFLMRLDHEIKHTDPKIAEGTRYGLKNLLAAQYPNGAWPQKFSNPTPDDFPILTASYPERWSRTFPKTKYSHYYTLNDNTISDTIKTMLLAYDIYGDRQFYESAIAGGDFFLRAQMPDPQPAWAQQYDSKMQPDWARKFEPPAITGGESQGVIKMLLLLYQRSGDKRFIDSADRALAYLEKSRRDDGKLPRFLELKTNRPLYFTKEYKLTYSDDDMPTHYAFIVSANLGSIRRRVNDLMERHHEANEFSIKPSPPKRPTEKPSKSLAKRAAEAIDALDDRGAWVETGEMRNYSNPTGEVIESRTFAKNLLSLARHLHSVK